MDPRLLRFPFMLLSLPGPSPVAGHPKGVRRPLKGVQECLRKSSLARSRRPVPMLNVVRSHPHVARLDVARGKSFRVRQAIAVPSRGRSQPRASPVLQRTRGDSRAFRGGNLARVLSYPAAFLRINALRAFRSTCPPFCAPAAPPVDLL